MKAFKKIVSAGLVATMAFSLAACGGTDSGDSGTAGTGTTSSDTGSTTGTTSGGDATGTTTANGFTRTDSDGNRLFYIGSWWTQHYDSADTDLTASDDYNNAIDQEGDDESTLAQNAINRQVAEAKFANVAKLEEKYGCKFYWQNLTYAGVQESITTSVLAGTPDADIYLVDTGMAIPAQANGLAVDLKTVLPEDADVFTDQNVISYLDLGDGKACILKRVEAQSQVEATYPLAFNKQMLDDNNLEDPRDLYERGEWTWDKFIEYCQVLTQDTDGDGQIDQYGYCGYEYETFENLMMSNGATIAVGTSQSLDSSQVGEALQMLSDMYNVYNICYPYDYDGSPSDSMRNQYTQGNVGFFPIAAWIESGNDDYDWNDDGSSELPFDVIYVRWPVGPSGDQETNAGKNSTSGEFYIIPAGLSDTETVYNFLYDYWNWMDGDYSLRDSKETLNWWYGVTGRDDETQTANFNVMNDCGSHTELDLWNSMGISYDLESVMKGEVTPAQFQETYKQQVQDGLDAYFN
jgi:hypothetical protein